MDGLSSWWPTLPPGLIYQSTFKDPHLEPADVFVNRLRQWLWQVKRWVEFSDHSFQFNYHRKTEVKIKMSELFYTWHLTGNRTRNADQTWFAGTELLFLWIFPTGSNMFNTFYNNTSDNKKGPQWCESSAPSTERKKPVAKSVSIKQR